MQERQKELLELLDSSGAEFYTLLTRLTLREETAEELMQELFIKLNSSKGFIKSDNKVAYARRAAINLVFDWRRKNSRTNHHSIGIDNPASNEESALSKLIKTEELGKMLDAIGRLKESWRRVIVMRYIQQQTYEDIAIQMGKKPHHVRAICSKAMNGLRKMLGANRENIYVKESKNARQK